ncbi:MAG TPA: hypothetical protein VFQ16_04705 [Burkholderiaceae bacterium]|nr:hypothetical protein [Burkholderiaceae bacterium]
MMLPRLVALFTLAAACVATSAGTDGQVPGQKLDSGLGVLPHYSKWTDRTGRDPMGVRVAGESLDDGLGELPHYSKWVDPTGRDPLGRERVALAASRR